MGLKRPNRVVSQAHELPAVLSPSTGKREQALGRCPGTELQYYPCSSGSRAGLQLPKQQMQPLPGCQILVSCGGWSYGHLCVAPWPPLLGGPRSLSVWQSLLYLRPCFL